MPKKLLLYVGLLFVAGATLLYAQGNAYQPQLLTYNGTPTGTCDTYQVGLDVTTGNFFSCSPRTRTWVSAANPGANINFTGADSFSQQITSTVATGTAPFSIASTTQVTNLNAQLHGGLSAPASAIVGISDTQTLIGKTYDTAGAGNVFKINGTQISAVTGSGSAVLATSPALTTPTVGSGAAISSSGSGGTMGSIATNLVGPNNVGVNSSTQTLVASVPSNGLSNITFNAVQTTQGVACSAGANNVSFNALTYTTPEGTVEVAGSTTLLSFTGNGLLDGGAGPGSGNTGSFSTTLIAKAGTSITFQITSTLNSTGCTTTPQYAVYTKAFF